MKELSFDFFTGNETGRALYRGLFIYAAVQGFKASNTSVAKARVFHNVIVKDFWKPRNCFIQMSPRIRWFYSSMLLSLIPHLVFKASTTYLGSHFYLHYQNSVPLGFLSGSAACYLTLCSPSLSKGYLGVFLGAGTLGMLYGTLYCAYSRYTILSKTNNATV